MIELRETYYAVRRLVPLVPAWALVHLQRQGASDPELLEVFEFLTVADLERVRQLYRTDPIPIEGYIRSHQDFGNAYMYVADRWLEADSTLGTSRCFELRSFREGRNQDREALLRHARANPRDPGGYLAIADWLEENGQVERVHLLRSVADNFHTPEQPGFIWIKNEPLIGCRSRFGYATMLRLPLPAWQRHVRNLWSECLLQQIELSDRTPFEHEGYSRWPRFRWFEQRTGTSLDDPSVLPTELFSRLPTHAACVNTGPVAFDTAQSAMEALSFACIAWARTLNNW